MSSISNFQFTPTGGLNDGTYSPTTPNSEPDARAQVQGISDQIRDFINTVILPTLHSTTLGASGSEEIGSPTITGLTGNTVYTQLVSLLSSVIVKGNTIAFTPTLNYDPATKMYVDSVAGNVVLGQVPDGSIGKIKVNSQFTSDLQGSIIYNYKNAGGAL